MVMSIETVAIRRVGELHEEVERLVHDLDRRGTPIRACPLELFDGGLRGTPPPLFGRWQDPVPDVVQQEYDRLRVLEHQLGIADAEAPVPAWESPLPASADAEYLTLYYLGWLRAIARLELRAAQVRERLHRSHDPAMRALMAADAKADQLAA